MSKNQLNILLMLSVVVLLFTILIFLEIKKKENSKTILSHIEQIHLIDSNLLCEVVDQRRITLYKCFIQIKDQKYLIGEKIPWIKIVNFVKKHKKVTVSQDSIIKVKNINLSFYINKKMRCIFNPFYDSIKVAIKYVIRDLEIIRKKHCLHSSDEILSLYK